MITGTGLTDKVSNDIGHVIVHTRGHRRVARQVSQASIVVNLAHWDERDVSQGEIMESLRRRFSELPGVETFVTEVPQVGGMRGLQLVLGVTRSSPTQTIDDVDGTLAAAEARFGTLDNLPFSEIIREVAAYQVRKRSRRRP